MYCHVRTDDNAVYTTTSITKTMPRLPKKETISRGVCSAGCPPNYSHPTVLLPNKEAHFIVPQHFFFEYSWPGYYTIRVQNVLIAKNDFTLHSPFEDSRAQIQDNCRYTATA